MTHLHSVCTSFCAQHWAFAQVNSFFDHKGSASRVEKQEKMIFLVFPMHRPCHHHHTKSAIKRSSLVSLGLLKRVPELMPLSNGRRAPPRWGTPGFNLISSGIVLINHDLFIRLRSCSISVLSFFLILKIMGRIVKITII